MWGVASALIVSDVQRRILEGWIAARNTSQKVAFRARIVLMACEGQANLQIARELKTTRPTVILWRKRFPQGGPDVLTLEAPRRGRNARIAAGRIMAIV